MRPKGQVPLETKQDLIRAYKILLREAVEARPAGIRLRIATVIGKNKSFVSQITHPNYATPLPEKYVEPILDAIHCTPWERERFLKAYRLAHPRAHPRGHAEPGQGKTRVLSIELPRLGSRQMEERVDRAIIEMARSLSELARRR